MKRTLLPLAVLSVIFFPLAMSSAVGQEGTQIKIKGTNVVTGVVIVDIQRDGKAFELQCNQGVASCQKLAGGTYWMVELPANFGMYDCQNVEVYRLDNGIPAPERLGQYCLIKK